MTYLSSSAADRLSELSCQYDHEGGETREQDISFPFALCLQPVADMPQDNDDDDDDDSRPLKTDAFLDDTQKHVPSSTPQAVACSNQLHQHAQLTLSTVLPQMD